MKNAPWTIAAVAVLALAGSAAPAAAGGSTGTACHVNFGSAPTVYTWPYERPTIFSPRVAPYDLTDGEAFRLHRFGPNVDGTTWVYGHTTSSFPADVWVAGAVVTCP